MPLLDGPEDAAAIRRLISPTLTATDLPDEVIYSAPYAGAVEAWLAREYPQSQTATGEDREAFRRAAMYLVAERFVGSSQSFTSEKFGDEYSYTIADGDADNRAAWFHARAMDELQPFAPDGGRLTVFGRAPGRRGRALR